jgi:hypothetical protein
MRIAKRNPHLGSAVLISILVGMILLALYLITKSPTITWEHNGADSGELAAAAIILGIPHPPGYPLWIILSHWALKVLPGTDPAGQLVILSCICAAMAGSLVTYASINLTSKFLKDARTSCVFGGITAGLFCGTSPLVWSQATIVEVYSLLALVVASVITLGLRWHHKQSDQGTRALPLIGLLIGLGTGIHLTILLLIPGFMPLFFKRIKVKSAIKFILCVSAGMNIFWVLPFFASRDPAISWGDATSLNGFLWLISGTPYQDLFLGLELHEIPQRTLEMSRLLARQFGGLGWALFLYGAGLLWQKDRRLTLSLTSLMIFYFTYAFLYGSNDSIVYIIPALLAGAIIIGIGSAQCLYWINKNMIRTPIFPFLAILALGPILSTFISWDRINLSSNDQALQYARSVSLALDSQDIFLVDTDRHIFSMWYYCFGLQEINCPRIITPALLQYRWYRNQISHQYNLIPENLPTYDAAFNQLLRHTKNERLYISTNTYPLPGDYTVKHQREGLYKIIEATSLR